MDSEHFFRILFHDKPKGTWILIWEKGEKKISHWFLDTQNAIKHFQANSHSQDTYVGCGTSPKDFGKHLRCRAEEITGIPGIWLDIDIEHEVHKKPNLAKTFEDAITIADVFPIKPNIIVHSGYGLQFWWIFEKFLLFKNQQERTAGAELVQRFTALMRDIARSRNAEIDMTHDLSRVMRIPGGFNFKRIDVPLPVRLIQHHEQYCDPHQLAKSIVEISNKFGFKQEVKKTERALIPSGTVSFKLNPKAEPPKIKFDALCEFEPRFLASWNKDRKDFRDKSPSAYDMSLATYAFNAEWEVQEVVDLLIAFRRKHNFDLKLREDYYLRTTNVARQANECNKAFEDLRLRGNNPDPLLEREEIQNSLFKILRIYIIRVIRFSTNPPEYRIETNKGSIHLGLIHNLTEQIYLRRCIADATGVLIPIIKKEKWQDLAQSLLDICETEEPDETSNCGQIRSWLTMYLQSVDPLYDPTDAMMARRPFFKGNCLYITGSDFRTYVQIHCRENLSTKTMGIMLREYGFHPGQVNVKTEKGTMSRTAWEINVGKDKIIQHFVNDELLDEANKKRAEEERKRYERSKNVDEF